MQSIYVKLKWYLILAICSTVDFGKKKDKVHKEGHFDLELQLLRRWKKILSREIQYVTFEHPQHTGIKDIFNERV